MALSGLHTHYNRYVETELEHSHPREEHDDDGKHIDGDLRDYFGPGFYLGELEPDDDD